MFLIKIRGGPLCAVLVVEILSEATKTTDRTSKKSFYQRHGVKEYWIVDATKKTIDQFNLREQILELCDTFEPPQTLTSSVIEEFKLPTGKNDASFNLDSVTNISLISERF